LTVIIFECINILELKKNYPDGAPSPKKSGGLPSVPSSSPQRSITKVDDEASETMSYLSMEGHGPGGSTISASSNMGDEYVHTNNAEE
jgi:hypothetical protein